MVWSRPAKPLEIAEPADSGSGEEEGLVLDPVVLGGLRELDEGEGAILRETVTVFLDSTPEKLEYLRQALDTGDLEAVERLAHTLKSSSGIIGGQRMTAVCARLEGCARRGSLDHGSAMLQTISEHFAALRSALADCPDTPPS